MNQQRQHNLLQLGTQLGYPAERVNAVFRRMADLHGRGDASRLGLQHQDEFLDRLSGLEEPDGGKRWCPSQFSPRCLGRLLTPSLFRWQCPPCT